MDFQDIERLVLKVLFETSAPVTSAHVAYLGQIPVRTAERHLARMVEQGTLRVRGTAAGVVEYVYPGRKQIADKLAAAKSAFPAAAPQSDARALTTQAPHTSPVTAVVLSMLVPGAGHIYSGQPSAGVAWMATTLMGYACFILPGLFLHGLCLVSAAQPRR